MQCESGVDSAQGQVPQYHDQRTQRSGFEGAEAPLVSTSETSQFGFVSFSWRFSNFPKSSTSFYGQRGYFAMRGGDAAGWDAPSLFKNIESSPVVEDWGNSLESLWRVLILKQQEIKI